MIRNIRIIIENRTKECSAAILPLNVFAKFLAETLAGSAGLYSGSCSPCLAPVVWPLNVPDLIKGWQVCGTFSSAWWRWFWLVSGFILWLVGSLQRCFDFMCAQEAEYSLCSRGTGALWFLSFQFRCQFSHDFTFPRYACIKTLAVPLAPSLITWCVCLAQRGRKWSFFSWKWSSLR